MTKLGSRKLHIFPKVTKMGSIIGHIIDYNGVGALRGQRHVPAQQKLTQLTQVPPSPRVLNPDTSLLRTVAFVPGENFKYIFSKYSQNRITPFEISLILHMIRSRIAKKNITIKYIDVNFIFDSARLGLFSFANILQMAYVALRIVFLLFLPDLPCF